MNTPEARAIARKHTAQLLKKLRGYGPPPVPDVTMDPPDPPISAESKPDTVAEASPTYVRLDATLPRSSPVPLPTPAHPLRPSLQPAHSLGEPPDEKRPARVAPGYGSIPTVGEELRRASGRLGRLVTQADEMNRRIQIFRVYLPPHLHDHALLIRMDEESWDVHTDSASWATRLRYALHNIHQELDQHLGITLPKPRIQVKPIAAPPPTRRPILTLTQQNAQLLEAAAHHLSDARLSAALLRLAARACPAPGTANHPPSER